MQDFPPIVDDNAPTSLERLEGESALDYTQRIRLATVDKLVTTSISDDPKDVAALNSVLDAIDRQEFNKAKIELDSQAAQSDKEAYGLIASLVNAVGNVNPYMVDVPVQRDISHEGPVVEGVVLVPGELDTKPDKMNYDSFMKNYKEKNPKNTDPEDD